MRRLLHLGLLLSLFMTCAVSLVQAQSCPVNYAQVVASKLGANAPLQSGSLTIVATDASHQPINYSVPEIGVILTKPTHAVVVNGAITSPSLLCIPRSDRSSVAVGYHFILRDTSAQGGNAVVMDAQDVAVTSDIWSLDSYAFTAQTNPYTLVPPPVFPSGPVEIPGYLRVDGAVTNYLSYDAYGDSITAGCCPATARIFGGAISPAAQTLSNWTSITNGSLSVTINGTVWTVTGQNFSTATSLTSVAQQLQAAFAALPGASTAIPNFSIQWNSVFQGGSFNLTSGVLLAPGSTITYATGAGGTDLSALLGFTSASGGLVFAGDNNFSRYVDLVAKAFGLTAVDHGISGITSFGEYAQGLDVPANVTTNAMGLMSQPVSATGRQLFTYAIGTNDDFFSGPAGIPQFGNGILNSIVWLTIPDGNNKVRANTFAPAANWSPSTTEAWGYAIQSTTNGATTAPVQMYGSVLYVGYTALPNGGGTFTVNVDGTIYGPYACNTAQYSGVPIDLGTVTYAAQVARIPGLSNQLHTVTITVTSATGAANAVNIDYIASNGTPLNFGGPRLLMGGTLRQGIGDPYTDDRTGGYNDAIFQSVALARLDGLNVAPVDVRSAQHGSAINSFLNLDLTHPNQAGHADIAQVYIDAGQAYYDATLRANANSQGSAQPGNFTSIQYSAGITNVGPAVSVLPLTSTSIRPNEINSNAGAGVEDFGIQYLTAGGGKNANTRGGIAVAGGGLNPLSILAGGQIVGYVDTSGNLVINGVVKQIVGGTPTVIASATTAPVNDIALLSTAAATAVAPVFTPHAASPGEIWTSMNGDDDNGTGILSAGGGTDLSQRGWVAVQGFGAPGFMAGKGNQVFLLHDGSNLHILGGIITTPMTPASSSSACTTGQMVEDANYIYSCTATNTWKRAPLSTW